MKGWAHLDIPSRRSTRPPGPETLARARLWLSPVLNAGLSRERSLLTYVGSTRQPTVAAIWFSLGCLDRIELVKRLGLEPHCRTRARMGA